jgi:hypothetical protein
MRSVNLLQTGLFPGGESKRSSPGHESGSGGTREQYKVGPRGIEGEDIAKPPRWRSGCGWDGDRAEHIDELISLTKHILVSGWRALKSISNDTHSVGHVYIGRGNLLALPISLFNLPHVPDAQCRAAQLRPYFGPSLVSIGRVTVRQFLDASHEGSRVVDLVCMGEGEMNDGTYLWVQYRCGRRVGERFRRLLRIRASIMHGVYGRYLRWAGVAHWRRRTT